MTKPRCNYWPFRTKGDPETVKKLTFPALCGVASFKINGTTSLRKQIVNDPAKWYKISRAFIGKQTQLKPVL